MSTELTDLKTVLNELLSTDPSVRKRADVQLQSQLFRYHDENRRSEPWPAEIQDLLAALPPDPATFLATLLADWAWACALQLQLRVGADQLATAEIVRWQPRDTALATPMHISRMSMYGFGVSQLFERIGSTGLPLRRAFCELLAHPEPIVPCVALDAIASMGAAAQDCFPAALEHLATSQFDSAKRTAVLNFARSVPDAVAVIRARLNANHGDAEIAALTYLLEQLGAGDPEVAGVLLRQIQRATTDEGRASCAQAAIRTVAALDVDARARSARELIPLFRVWSSDASERLRAAAAFGLAAFGSTTDADLLLRLAGDAHPWVITELAWGVELSGNATTDIVTEFGKRLGDYSGFDGEPHDAMISALTRLAPNTDISAIQADLVRWVDALATESYDYHAYTATFELIERLPGSLQRALLPSLHRVERYLIEDGDDVALQQPDGELEPSFGDVAQSVSPEMAALLDAFKADWEKMDAECAAEREEVWGAVLADVDESGESPAASEEPAPYEDERVTRIRSLISRINEEA